MANTNPIHGGSNKDFSDEFFPIKVAPAKPMLEDHILILLIDPASPHLRSFIGGDNNLFDAGHQDLAVCIIKVGVLFGEDAGIHIEVDVARDVLLSGRGHSKAGDGGRHPL